MVARPLGWASALRIVVGTCDKAVMVVASMVYFLLGKNWPTLACVTMWWDGSGARVCQDVDGVGGVCPDVEGTGDVETFLAGVEVEVGNGVAMTLADDDVEAGVGAMIGVETGVGDDDDMIAGVNIGGETGVGDVVEVN
jgi:hypothetical protein